MEPPHFPWSYCSTDHLTAEFKAVHSNTFSYVPKWTVVMVVELCKYAELLLNYTL